MNDLGCEWDPRQPAATLRKHGVSFTGAPAVFADEHGLIIDDPEHSAEEDRFILLGVSATSRPLVVVHCDRASDSVIRVIPARKADHIERQQYEGDRHP